MHYGWRVGGQGTAHLNTMNAFVELEIRLCIASERLKRPKKQRKGSEQDTAQDTEK